MIKMIDPDYAAKRRSRAKLIRFFYAIAVGGLAWAIAVFAWWLTLCGP